MTNEKIVVEKKKESKFTKHLNKHKSAYITAAGAGVVMVGMKLKMDKELETMVNGAYRLGMRDEAQITWNRFVKHIKAGKLVMDLVGTTDDDILNYNMDMMKELVEAEEE